MDEQKNSYWKFVGWFLAIMVVATAIFIGLQIREKLAGQDAVRNAAEALKRAGEESYRQALADTYGGKTPQETLTMYIAAVEKGDYVLASKYFIGDNQEKELNKLNNLKQKNNLDEYLSYLRIAEPWQSSLTENNFTMESKIDSAPSFFIRFTKYPNDIWKIIEI